MPVDESQKRAIKKYAQSDKGRAAFKRAHEKRANTDEYRAYQRQKQAEYRRRKRERLPLSKDIPSELFQGRESSFSVNENDFAKLDKLIENLEVNLSDLMAQQGLSYEVLPSNYQAILDALHTWKGRQREP